MMKRIMKKVLAVFMCFVMLAPILLCAPFASLFSKAANDGREPVTTMTTSYQDGVEYSLSQTTQYLGSRTYSVKLEMSANLSSLDHARVRTYSKNGYITIEQSGYYLVEMWGGRGGSGNGGAVLGVPTPGGNGAQGGYVYGKVFLEAGQTLAYNIGTNGIQSTVHNDGTGGVGGDSDSIGGTHGEDGSRVIGAGGGYTAVYLFDQGEFQPESADYKITETEFKIPEAARLSRYLMIAGGGGGGGAAMGGELVILVDNGTPMAPNGGAGGNINRGVSVSLLGNNYDVQGYVFSGRNGTSSGTDNTWIGRGGSNVPGVGSVTRGEQFGETKRANDWTGTYSSNVPGAGGSGNFRGGGGGSGYAGGSGGLMAAQLTSAHVGGGGGGSSFIARTANEKEIEFLNLESDTTKYLSGINNQPEGSSTGGAMQITYLSGEEGVFYQEALNKISITGNISKYFEILKDVSKVSDGATLTTTVKSDESTQFTASNLSVVPISPTYEGKKATVTIFVRAKEGFAGGNSVPLVNGVKADFLSPNDNVTPLNITPEEQRVHNYVNVPLNFKVRTHSYTSSQKGKVYQVTSLYTDDFTNKRDSLTSYWEYDYLSTISKYRVFDDGREVTGTVAPEKTTPYDVRFEVVPKVIAEKDILVGPAIENPKVISGKAVISVVEPGTAKLNELYVTGAKNLSYADGTYTFSTIIDQKSNSVPVNAETQIFNTAGDSIWTAPEDGWYYVEAWGGNGGKGGDATLSWNYVNSWGSRAEGSSTITGASGGKGGYVNSYVYLTAGTTVSFSIGAAGGGRTAGSSHATDDNQRFAASGAGGYGGKATSVTLGTDTILIAGGGGGGGGAGYAAKTLQLGKGLESENSSRGSTGLTSSSPASSTSETFDGGSGGAGNAYWYQTGTIIKTWTTSVTGGSAGTAGKNYTNPSYGITQNGYTLSAAAQKYAQETINTTKTYTRGQVAFTLIENAAMAGVMDTVKGLETQVAFTRYFDIDSIDLKVGTSYNSKSTVNNADGSKTVTYTHNTYGTVAKFTYCIDTLSDGTSVITISDCDYALSGVYTKTDEGYEMYYMANLEFSYKLTPKEGFLGGNDVPVLAYGKTGNVADEDTLPDCGVRISQGTDFMNLPAAGPTDFANVEYNPDMSQYLTVQDKTIHLGDSVKNTELYTFEPPTYSDDDWRDDYAYFAGPQDIKYTPNETTDYLMQVVFAPRITGQTRATIVETLGEQTFGLNATVYVEVPVTTELTNLVYEGETWTLWGDVFACTIVPKAGYLLPSDIEVTVGGEKLQDFEYNPSIGSIQIQGSYVTGPIKISGKAEVQTYEIHFVYAEYDPETGKDKMHEVVSEGYEADSTVNWRWVDDIVNSMPAREGYAYRVSYDTEDGKRPATMPANHLWVYGQYEKEQYKLTINYLYEDGTEAAESYSEYVLYQDNYVVTSPVYPEISKKGYLPDQTVVSGTMGTGDVTVNVTYTPSKNKLVIIYQKADGTQMAEQVAVNVATDAEYSISSPIFAGYTVDKPMVAGKMNGDESEIFIVTYTPNTYKLTFVYKNDGHEDATLDCDTNERLVEFDNKYGYNAKDKVYDGLPTAQVAGYTFVGWYKDSSYTQEVTSVDYVDVIEDTTLYARWKATEYKLSVRYEFRYEEGDYIPEGYADENAVKTYLAGQERQYSIAFGENYNIGLPTLVGYTAYQNFGLTSQNALDVLSGTMPAQNKVLIITYEINTYEIIFKDNPSGNIFYSDEDTTTLDLRAHEQAQEWEDNWQTVYLKHNVVPSYGGEAPTHATCKEYTYEFTAWESSQDGLIYSGVNPTFPAATGNTVYSTMYSATENILSVSYGSKISYFTDVASAVTFAEENISSGSVKLTFQRNEGNGTVVDITGDTMVFGETYTGTNEYTITVDVNGLEIQSTQGETAIENTAGSISLKLVSLGAEGKISVNGDGDVVAINSDSRNLTFGDSSLSTDKPLSVEATSINGSATAIKIAGNKAATYAYFYVATPVSAVAPNGEAIAMQVAESTNTVSINASVATTTLNADGQKAIGIDVDGANASVSNYQIAMNVSATEEATGIRVRENGTLANTSAIKSGLAIQSQGIAYGIRNEGAISSLRMAMNVSATGNAYGIYNDGGTITLSGIQSEVNMVATSTNGSGYGLYNVEGKTTIGDAENSSYLKIGAFAGSSYGIYSADDSIYASGNTVYFKGADANTALAGVVHEGYQQTDATAQFKEGYFRLAAERKIIFDTNGGTELDDIVQLFDTPVSFGTTTKLGYTFDGWYTDEDLTTAYTIPTMMPDASFTLYAKWNLNEYKYTLDSEVKPATIRFYKNVSTTDTTLVAEVSISDLESDLPDEIKDMTYKSGTTLYVHRGWYTDRTPTTSNYVDLSGDLSRYMDEDGVINLYAGWYSKGSCGGYAKFDINETDPVSITTTYTSSNRYYWYYVIPKTGTYTVQVANVGGTTTSYRQDLRIFKSSASSEVHNTYTNYVSSKTYANWNLNNATLYAGEVVLVSVYRAGSYTTSTYVKMKPGVDVSGTNTYKVSAASSSKTNIYTVEDGDNGVVTLPKGEAVNRSNLRFAGWADYVNASPSDYFMQLTPEMINTVEEWQNGEVWQLYSQWDERTWDSYTSDERDFSEFITTGEVEIEEDETVSLRFETDTSVNDAAVFKFKNGLMKGTILTLVDKSGSVPQYYSYTVKDDLLKEVSSTKFTKMGDSSTHYNGKGTNVILQICYANASVNVTDEEVGIYVSNLTAEAEVTYKIVGQSVAETTLNEVEVNYEETFTSDITVPSLQGKGYADTDKVYLRITWEGDSLAPGVRFATNTANAKVYDGAFAKLELGTVSQYSTQQTISVTSDFETMMQNEFADKKFTYEICVISGENTNGVVFGTCADVVARATRLVTVTETPILGVSDVSTRRVIAGENVKIETISVENNDPGQVEFYIQTLTEDGRYIYTNDCGALFDSASVNVSETGQLTSVSGTLLSSGVFTAKTVTSAPVGKFYLQIIYGDKMIVVPIRIVETE